MNKQSVPFILLLGACALMQSSCVDDTYDVFNKEISTDVSIPGNKITVPLGSMKPVVLDDLINVDEIDILTKGADGVYSISTSDDIEPIEIQVDPIKFQIDTIKEHIDVDFSNVEINNVHISAPDIKPTKFTTPTISLDELNEKLPVLKSNQTRAIVNDDLQSLLDLIHSSSFNESLLPKSIDVTHNVVISNEAVDCSFAYNMPSQVATINNIQLTTLGTNDPNGTLVNLVVTHPHLLINTQKSIDFDITFPDMFVLAKNENVDQAEKFIITDNRKLSVSNLLVNGDQTSISFYLKSLTGIDRFIKDGVVSINDKVVYNISYKVDGEIVPSVNLTAEDFEFNVSLDVPLAFSDASGATKEINIDFEPIEMHFSGHFDNLEHIDRIEYIEFVEEASHIKLMAQMEKEWLKPFKLKDGYALKIDFPVELEICPIHSQFEGKGKEVVYNEEEHAFYIYDLAAIAGSQWDLALKKLTLNVPVVNGEYDMDEKASISVVDPNGQETNAFVFAPVEIESLSETFNLLKGEKSVQFVMDECDLTIADAKVHTETITAEFANTTVEFNLNEEVPTEIGRIEAIDFAEDVLVKLQLHVQGLDDLDTDIVLDLKAKLPTFMCIQPLNPSDDRTTVQIGEYNDLTIHSLYHPGQIDEVSVELLCTGLDFTNDEFGPLGLVPEKRADGKSYLVYSTTIPVEGEAAVKGTDFHSTVLNNDVIFDVDFSLSEIEVKTFHGIYAAEIDPIEETINLDLGDDLAFLKEDGNGATLAEPQLEVVISNSISIPVNAQLELYGMDENGMIIEDSHITETIKINPANYDSQADVITPVDTKLFITCDQDLEPKIGYDKVLIPQLANLLKKVPESIYFKLNPIIDQTVTHHVDITKPLSFSGSYAVNVPLKFDNFNLTYKETIEDINANLGEVLEVLSNVKAAAKISLLNTIPVGLKLTVTPLDADGNVIEDITIDEIAIKAGLGSDIVNADGSLSDQEAQLVEFEIKTKTGDISKLDKLALELNAATNHVAGSVGIAAGQGIKISNVVIEIEADIETEIEF